MRAGAEGIVLLLVVAMIVASARFTLDDGRLLRRRPRRRWPVGRRTARVARAFGFRRSTTRDALVPRPFRGRFGPVLLETVPPPTAWTLSIELAPAPPRRRQRRSRSSASRPRSSVSRSDGGPSRSR